MSRPTGIAAIADQLRTYLAAHPDATDDLQGVADNWLGAEQPETAMLLEAVKTLVAEGVLKAQRTSDGRTLYSCRGDCR